MITLDDALEKIEQSFVCIQREKDKIEIPALKEIERSMKVRIHTKGKDSFGDDIGKNSKRKGRYSPGYEKRKREGFTDSRGRRYAGTNDLYPINLELFGDMRRSYSVFSLRGQNVMGFQDDFQKMKADKMGEYYRTSIFRPSKQELEDSKEVFVKQIESVLKKCL